jgi:hypothetical protein
MSVTGTRIVYGIIINNVPSFIRGQRYCFKKGRLYLHGLHRDVVFQEFCKDHQLRSFYGEQAHQYILGFQMARFGTFSTKQGLFIEPTGMVEWHQKIATFEKQKEEYQRILDDIRHDCGFIHYTKPDFISLPVYGSQSSSPSS